MNQWKNIYLNELRKLEAEPKLADYDDVNDYINRRRIEKSTAQAYIDNQLYPVYVSDAKSESYISYNQKQGKWINERAPIGGKDLCTYCLAIQTTLGEPFGPNLQYKIQCFYKERRQIDMDNDFTTYLKDDIITLLLLFFKILYDAK